MEEEMNWWDESAKQKISQTQLEDNFAQLGEYAYHLVENSVSQIIDNENEELIKKTVENHLKSIHNYVYNITLCESWMEKDTINSICKDFYDTISNGIMVLEHMGLDENKIVKLKRKLFVDISGMYTKKLLDQVEIVN